MLFGDNINNYPVRHGPATVANVSKAIRQLLQTPDLQSFAFVSSGHGSGDGTGNSYLCMVADHSSTDQDEQKGVYRDWRLAEDLASGCNPDSWRFVHLDHCCSCFGDNTPLGVHLFFMPSKTASETK